MKPSRTFAALAGLAWLWALAALAAVLTWATPGFSAGSSRGYPSTATAGEIPAAYLVLYERAAQSYGLNWAVLAGVGKVECDHGRDPDPSCTQEGSVNAAGAGGPAQFLSSTWSRYGVDGDGDGKTDRWDPADAIYSMANYLRASGAPSDYRRALFAYNHAQWYVTDVLRWAARYEREDPTSPEVAEIDGQAGLAGLGGQPLSTGGRRARLSGADGHLALVPSEAPIQVQAMVIAGNELQGLPYGPTGHPDPRGATSEDCSSTVNYVLYRSGVRPIQEIVRENPLAQDYLDWGEPGPGRWVSVYATTQPTDHVFIVIAGLRLDTSHNGTDVGPNRDEGGPRWRILGHIPTWAHWTVRHPPGL